MLTSCGSSNPGLSGSTACFADQAHCLSLLPESYHPPPQIQASPQELHWDISPAESRDHTVTGRCWSAGRKNILSASAERRMNGKACFLPKTRLFFFAAVLQKQASPPWPQHDGGSRVPCGTSSRCRQGRRTRCPLLPTPPLQSDSPHLSFQL